MELRQVRSCESNVRSAVCSAQSQKMHQALTAEQKEAVSVRIISLRLELMRKINEEKYLPHAVCPKCGRKLKPFEILKGFRQDPNDITTKCPKCGHRFVAKMINWNAIGRIETAFYCPMQTLERLRPYLEFAPENLRSANTAVYNSAKFHFGTLKTAFAKIGLVYPHKEKEAKAWEKKVRPFLGRLPDSMIAQIVGKNRKTVAMLRNKLAIHRFNGNEL